MHSQLVLSPVQRKAADALLEGISVGGVVVLKGDSGSGKSVILEHIHGLRGGALIGVREFLKALAERQPEAIEEAFLRVVEDALSAPDLVLVDVLLMVTYIVEPHNFEYCYLLDATHTAQLRAARVPRTN